MQLPARVPFGNLEFDLVVMTDVLEHLDDPAGALRALQRRLKPGGALLATVPAGPWMWSEHDVTHHHRRRFRAAEFGAMLRAGGFEIIYLSHYNFLLFPAIAGARLIQRLRRPDVSAARHDLTMPPPALNRILRGIFASERFIVGAARIPFGVSLIAMARTIAPADRFAADGA